MHNKSILIAGATGMVGQALVPYLTEKGYSVKILTRNVAKAKAVCPANVAIYKWPSGNEKALLGNSQGCEAVINLAGANIGAKRWTNSYKKQILNSRVNSIVELEKLVKHMPNKPKVWIQASAIGYYGNNTEHGKGEGFLSAVVNQWEGAFDQINIGNVRKVTLRFGVVLSANEGMLFKMKRAFNLGLAVCPGNGEQMLSWIHIDDLVQIIYLSIQQQSWHGAINVVSPNSLNMWEFTRILQNKTKALLAIKVPAAVFKLLLGSEKANELLLASQYVKPGKLLEYNFQYRFKNFQDTL